MMSGTRAETTISARVRPTRPGVRREALIGWLLLGPSLGLIGGLIVYPIVYNPWLSLFDKHAFLPAQTFVGVRHYRYLGRDYIMWSLILTSVWQFFPFVVVTYLARLQTIPPELYEAAKVDGAGAWRRFVHVTLPQTATVLFVIVLLRSIWMFTKFDTVWLMAGEGGVSRYVRTLPVYAYARTFTYLQAGVGAAPAVILFLMLLVATVFYFRVLRDEEATAGAVGASHRRPAS